MVHPEPTLVTVVIPCRNGAATLGEQLAALAGQDYEGAWEVLLVDNGSTDGSAQVALSWADRLPAIRVHTTGARGVSNVRNEGVREANGDLIALCDADDVVQPHWLQALAHGARDADIVGGAFDVHTLNKPHVVYWRGEVPKGGLMRPFDHLPFAAGCSMAVWRDVHQALGGWDATYRAGSEDVDFCWRAIAAGYRVAYAEDAVHAYRYRDGLGALARQYYLYGYTEAQLYKTFRADLPRYGVRDLLRIWKGIAGVLIRVRDRAELGRFVRHVSYRWGRLAGGVKYRVFVP